MIQNHRTHQERLYYVLLFFILLFTAGASYLLAPLVLLGGALVPPLVLFVIGVVFGLFIEFFMRELDLVTHHHHGGIWLVFLIGAVINFGLVYANSHLFAEQLGIRISATTPAFSALALALGFFIPYFIHTFKRTKKATLKDEDQ
jgi:hypothetical protein